jgi:hypothetical protein
MVAGPMNGACLPVGLTSIVVFRSIVRVVRSVVGGVVRRVSVMSVRVQRLLIRDVQVVMVIRRVHVRLAAATRHPRMMHGVERVSTAV